MTKKKDQYHKVFERIHFSKYFKRRALLAFSKLKKPNEALRACGINLEEFNITDKKYAAKLLHKWRKEMYANFEMLNILNYDLTDEVLKREIESIKVDPEDKIMNMMQPYIDSYLKKKNLTLEEYYAIHENENEDY